MKDRDNRFMERRIISSHISVGDTYHNQYPLTPDECFNAEEKVSPFDEEFAIKLKAFYSDNLEYRRTGRTTLIARIIVELAIETEKDLSVFDHLIDYRIHDRRHVAEEVLHRIRWVINDYASKGVDLYILDLNPNRVSIRIAPYRYSSNNSLDNYRKHRLPDAVVTKISKKLTRSKSDDMLLICCNIV